MANTWTALTKTQYGIYLEWIAYPERTTYNLPFLKRLEKGMDLERLKTALEAMVRVHPILTCVIRADEKGEIFLSEEADITLKVTELSDEDFALKKEALVRPFLPDGSPLARYEAYVTPSGTYIFVDIHHIIADGMSVGILNKDLVAAYMGRTLEAETRSYRDEAAEEKAQGQGPAYEEGRAYYEKLLEGFDPDSAPSPDSEGGQPSQGWFTLEFALDDEAFRAMRHDLGISSSAYFTAAVGYTAAIYNYAETSLISTIYSGRDTADYARTVSMLVRTMPFVTDLTGDPEVSVLLKNAQDHLTGCRAVKAFAYTDVVQTFGLGNDINFAYQARVFDQSLVKGQDNEVTRLYDPAHIEETKLLFEISDKGKGSYSLHCGFRRDSYTEAFAQGYARSIIRAAQEMLIRQKVSEIVLADEKDLALLDSFNETEVPYDHEKTVVDLFREQAAAHPETTCVVSGETSYTYGEVDALTDALAAELIRQGMGRGTIGAVLIPRSENMVICSLGLLKTGGAYLPLDPSYPAERLNLMVRDSGAILLLTTPELSGIIEEDFRGPRLMTEDIPFYPAAEAPLIDIEPEDLFTMLYTSGSTGLPKGVMIEHSNLMVFVAQDRAFRHMTDRSRHAAYASYGFDANMQDMWTPLTSGAALYIIPEDMRLDLQAVYDYFRENEITHSMMTTQIARQFAALGNPGSLECLVTGGEKLASLDPPDYTLINAYGPTEGTVYCTAVRLDKKYRDIPIGKAVDNARLYVVDKAGRRLPVGAAGELWLSGPKVTRGYLNRPEKTAEAYLDNPFTDDPAYKRTYRTGDVVRYLSDGSLQFIGRRDAQVKIRGFRIELTEVEEVIRRYPDIKDVTVAAFDNPSGGKFIAAYVVSDEAVDIDGLNAFILSEKPPYMVPEVTMQIEAIPYTQNQKVNKRALPAPERRHEEVTIPENETQQTIYDILADLLGHREFGIDSDIYLAGLTSIASAQFTIRLSNALEVPVRTADIKENSTIRRLAEALTAAGREEESLPLLDDYPLSKTQMGVYVECQDHPDSTIYNIPLLMAIDPAIEIGTLKKAVVTAINAHPYCLTSFVHNEKGEVRARREGRIYTEEMIAEKRLLLPKDGSLPASLKKQLVRPFDLDQDTLVRTAILEDGRYGRTYFFIDTHHIISDGTSLNILLADISRAYEGEEVPCEVFSGYEAAQVEEKRLASEEYDKARAYYNNLLDGVDPDCAPERTLYGETETTEVFSYTADIPASAYKAFCKDKGISMNALFTGAFAYVIGSYIYKNEALITTVYNGRSDSRLERTVSMLVKTIPVRAAWKADTRVSDYLTGIGDQLLGNMTHDLYAFSEMAHDYGVRADMLFVYQGDLFDQTTFCGRPAETLTMVSDTAKALMTINVFIHGDQLAVEGDFRSDVYDIGFITGLAKSLCLAASSMMKAETMSGLSMTDGADEAVLDAFNDNAISYDEVHTIVDLFRQAAAEGPDRTALIFKEKRITYAELDEMTDRLALHFASLGVGREKTAAVLIPRCEYMATASLGILKAGGAYVPLDPSYPPERLNLMLADSGAVLLITTPELDPIITEDYTGPRIMLSELDEICQGPALTGPEKDSLTALAPGREDLFIMLYTSGSTGVPKGVMLEERNLMAFCAWIRRVYGLDGTSIVAAYASYGFDACMLDMYPTLTAGSTLMIVPEELRLDLVALYDYFAEIGVTHTFMTTQIGRQFAGLGSLPSLKVLGVGGEKLVSDAVPNYLYLNVYGPTECTVFVTCFDVDDHYRDIPIGKALENVSLYIVDPFGNRLPVGASGELWIAGPQVSRGYLNRPDKTAEAYIVNPFEADENHKKVYRTGDVVRYLPDGTVQFIGRRDAQVKVRGFRIELTEVEEVIRRCPGIRDVTVAAYDDPAGGKFIAAYVVSEDGSPVDIKAMNDFISAEKPPYMVPAVTMQIEAIPYNQNQKVNKRALPVPERQALDLTPPENETQQKIYDVLKELLGHGEFGIDTDIYEAGLTSIGAVQFNVKLSGLFDTAIRTRDIKENATVRKLALLLGGAEKVSEEAAASAEEESSELRSDYPLTKTQMGIFAECLAHPDSVLYNMPMLLEIDPSLDRTRLKEACAAAVNAHPYLLTTLFAGEGGAIRQKRYEGEAYTADLVREETLADLEAIRAAALQPFNLIGGRLFEVALFTAEDTGAVYLMADLHHIIGDGTSLNILLSGISKAYVGETLKKETYTGYEVAAEEERKLAGPELSRAKASYDSLLADAETDCLPPRTVRKETEEAAPIRYIPGRSAEAYRAFCQKAGISMSTLFNGAFGYVLGRYLYKDDVLYTTIYNGRNDLRKVDIISMLVKTFPVRCRWEEKTGVTAYLQEIEDQMADSMANDIYSFAEMAHDHGVSADILFTYQGDSFAFDSLCGKKARMVDLTLDAAKAAMDIDIIIRDGQMAIEGTYRSDLYDETFMTYLCGSIFKAADAFAENETLSAVSLLTPEMAELLAEQNATDHEVAEEAAHRLFEREAAAYPDRRAVVAGGEELTYGELNTAANEAARGLIRLGLKTGEVVGLIVPRRKEAFIGELAILKSGGAFLPMVPEYPDERIDFCLTDASCRFVLTTEAIKADRTELFEGKAYQVLTFEDLKARAYESDRLVNCEGGVCRFEEVPAETIAQAAVSDPDLGIPSDSLAYCIYTSGSTGTPKGVMITHGNLRNFLDANDKNPETNQYALYGHVVLSVISVAFDFSIMETQLPLAHGLTVCMADEEMIHDPIALARFMKENGVDTMSCTPSFIGNMVDVPEIREALGNMALYDFGAEAFPSALYDKLEKASPNAVICNGYGPTETTISCISKVLTSGDSITIGRPAANVRAYVCDKQLHEVPIGACGELVIGGRGVGRGYVGLPEKTAAVFVEKDGEKVYRSGDLVRYLPGGEIEFFGRLDNQVKLRGFRVELDEISNTINTFPGIVTSIVVVRNNGSFDYLAGFYTADREIDNAALTAHLKEKLTYYMVPPVLVQLEAMPLTVNGKIDKKKLPESAYTVETVYVAPANETEKTICDIMQEVLGLERVGAEDNFFEIGGTSLTATNVVLRLTDAGYAVVYKNVFDYPTAREMAAFLTGETVKEKHFGDDYDYSAIRSLISADTMAEVDRTHAEETGDLILTGATGFLGIHILYSYLTGRTGHITCLIRRGKYKSPEDRLKNMWMYYFGTMLPDDYVSRITCLEADITEPESLKALADIPADTIINSAALVKHFVQDDSLDRINVGGVENLIELCLSSGKRLIQISTTSVGGMLGEARKTERIREDMLFFDQVIENDYIRTKFLAERALLEAKAKKGLRGGVIRVGNLMSRASDGEFQINFITSGFMRSLKAYRQIGVFPMSMMYAGAEFSPIDSTADAILTLVSSGEEFSIFHAYNSHIIYMSDVIAAMRKYGFDIRIVDDVTFGAAVREASRDPALRDAVLGIIAYNSDDETPLYPCDADNRFTTEVLYRLGYLWPITDNAYLENVIAILDGFDFFEVE